MFIVLMIREIWPMANFGKPPFKGSLYGVSPGDRGSADLDAVEKHHLVAVDDPAEGLAGGRPVDDVDAPGQVGIGEALGQSGGDGPGQWPVGEPSLRRLFLSSHIVLVWSPSWRRSRRFVEAAGGALGPRVTQQGKGAMSLTGLGTWTLETAPNWLSFVRLPYRLRKVSASARPRSVTLSPRAGS